VSGLPWCVFNSTEVVNHQPWDLLIATDQVAYADKPHFDSGDETFSPDCHFHFTFSVLQLFYSWTCYNVPACFI